MIAAAIIAGCITAITVASLRFARVTEYPDHDVDEQRRVLERQRDNWTDSCVKARDGNDQALQSYASGKILDIDERLIELAGGVSKSKKAR